MVNFIRYSVPVGVLAIMLPNLSADSGPTTREVVSSYLSWKPQANVADAENPHRRAVLERGEKAVPDLIAGVGSEQDRLSVIWILGEIGSPKSFPYLLSEYMIRPSPRVALSIGSSLGDAEIDYLFAGTALSEVDLRGLLATIVVTDWSSLKDKPLGEIRKSLRDNRAKVRELCREKSRPQSG